MESSVFMKVMLVIIIIIQIVATVFAIRLVRRTKYNSIWFLCIVGFIALSVERICLLVSPEWTATDPAVFVVLDLVISLCISAAVLFAHRLINYIDRLDRQRQLFNKRILTAVLRTEERSRSYFAKELHDGMGPLLSSAKMSLSALSKKGLSLEQQEILANTSYVIDEAIRSVREISNNMSPQVLNDFGLAQGIKGFISRSIALHGINIRFTTNLRKERFDNDVEVIMYRVICELINNSLKHSGCSAVNLSLSFDGAELKLDYTDNGRGFNPKAVLDCGMGLSNIASRVNSLNGTFDIESRKGEGMKAVVRVNTAGGGISTGKENTYGRRRRKTNRSGR